MPRRDSLSSLDPSSVSSDDGYDPDEQFRIAQQEWEENIRQLQQLLSVVLLPYIGKWLGRKWAHSMYARYKQVGWSRALLFGGQSS